MRFAYLTTDEVNEALAFDMAQTCGVVLDPLAPKDGPPGAGYDAVVIDWDHWPDEQRKAFLTGLHDCSQPRPAVVHSYQLEGGPAIALRARGVVVHRRLELEVFQALKKPPAPVGPSDSSDIGPQRCEVGYGPEPPSPQFVGTGV